VEGPPEDRLVAVLERARRVGFLGPGPVADHLRHAIGFEGALGPMPDVGPCTLADLGSGGGIPGLVLAVRSPALHVVLVEAGRRRADHLEAAVAELGLGDRVRVVAERAEVFARTALGVFDGVVARGFARPAATAECAAPLLRLGGVLVTSEPPEPDPERWPAGGLAELGLRADGLLDLAGRGHFHRCVLEAPCPERYPRRVGVPEKRPLW
jgi:16S rRNA (guanine527-N7)-methyltransferase